MTRVQVKYHRAILDSDRRILFPAGAIIDLDQVPPGQHDRVFIVPEAPEAVVKAAEKPAEKEEPEVKKYVREDLSGGF